MKNHKSKPKLEDYAKIYEYAIALNEYSYQRDMYIMELEAALRIAKL